MDLKQAIERIFIDGTGTNSPFRSKAWPLLLFGETLPKTPAKYFDALSRTALKAGDSRVYFVGDEERDLATSSSWDADDFCAARFRIPLGALIFGESCRWGGVLTDEGFTCIGGEHEIMTDISTTLGGLASVRREFQEWVASAEGLLLSSEKANHLRRLNQWEPPQRVQ